MHRLGCVLFLAVVAVLAGLPAAAASQGTTLPGSDYHWMQPGAAFVATLGAQPPAWIPIAPTIVRPAVAAAAYEWAQPGTAPVSTPGAQPPAWVPIG